MLYVVGPVSNDFRNYFEKHDVPYRRFATNRITVLNDAESAVDFSSTDTIKHSLDSLQLQDLPTAILVTGYEQYVWSASIIAQYFNVPFCSPDAARRATDKSMRQAFLDTDPAITPALKTVRSLTEALEFAAEYGYPIMLKPASLIKSMLITKSTDDANLTHNYHELSDSVGRLYQKYHITEAPKVIIEQFMEGTMHTVAGFIDNTGKAWFSLGITDCTTAQQIGLNDNYLFSRSVPSLLSSAQQQALYTVAAVAVRALNVTSCPVHVELIYTASGPKVIQVGARLGGYRPRMYTEAYGVDFYGAALDLANGKPPTLTQRGKCSIGIFS